MICCLLALATMILLIYYVLTNDSTWTAIKKKVAASGYVETGCHVVIDACNWRKMLDDGDRQHKRIALAEAECQRLIAGGTRDVEKESFLQERLDAALAAADTARLQMSKWHVATLNGVEVYIHADTPEAAAAAWAQAY